MTALTSDQVLDHVLDRESGSLKTNPLGGRTTINIGGRGGDPSAIYNSVLKDSPAPTLDTTGITATKDATNDLGYIVNLTTAQTDDGWVRTPDGIRPTINQTTHDLYKADVFIHFDNQDNPLLTNFSAVYEENLRGVKGDKGVKGDGADGLLHLRPDLKIYKAVYRGTNIGVSGVPASPLFRPEAVTYNKTNGDLNVIIPTSGVGGAIVNNQGWVFVKSESDIPREVLDGLTRRSGHSIDIFVIDIRTVLNVNAESSNLVTATSIDIGTAYLYDATNAINVLGGELETETTERNLEVADIISGNAMRDIGGGRTEPVGTAPDRRSLNELGSRVDTLEERSGGPSETFIETLVDSGINIHNKSDNAHAQILDPITRRIEILEENTGDSGGSSSESPTETPHLQILSVNDGVTLFQNEESVPNELIVQFRNASGTEISGIRNSVTAEGLTFSGVTFSDTENGVFNAASGSISSSSVPSFLKIPVRGTTALNRNFSNIARNRGGRNATFEIFSTNNERIGGFSITVGKPLTEMLGAVGLSEPLTQALPQFMMNMFQQVLSNIKTSYSHVYLQSTDALAGPGKVSVNFALPDASLVLSVAEWAAFLNGSYLRIYLSENQVDRVPAAPLSNSGVIHCDFHYSPFLNADGTIDGDVLAYEFEPNSGDQNRVRVIEKHLTTTPNTRAVNIRSTGISRRNLASTYVHLVGVELFTPSYSFELPRGTTVAGLTPP